MIMEKCPNCGFKQAGAEECPRCGIIFAKYQARQQNSFHTLPEIDSKDTPSSAGWMGGFKRFYKVLRWVVLIGLILVLFLVLRTEPPPDVAVAPDALSKAEAKLATFRERVGRGSAGELELDEAELNAWLGSNLALRRKETDGHPRGGSGPAVSLSPDGKLLWDSGRGSGENEASLQEIQSSVTHVGVNLGANTVRVYVSFMRWGREMSFALDTGVHVENGYLRLDPISGSLGSLPLPASALRAAVDRALNSAENREKFKVPDAIRNIQVRDGKLQLRYR